jgi:hypothetical protein
LHAAAAIEPFTLTFDRPLIRPEALVLVPDPVQPLDNLRNTVRSAIEKGLGPGAVDLGPTDFQPHVSFAYVSADQPASQALGRLDAVAGQHARFRVDVVPLIEMHRDNRMYEWRTLDRMQLGSAL